MSKILIIHDRFKFRGGAERLVLIMARGLNADIATEYWNEEESFRKSEAPAKVIVLGKQIRHAGLSYFSAQGRFFWKTKFLKDYDTIIFSGNNCLSAAWRAPEKKKVMYCHTPVRYAYDLKDHYYRSKVWWKKPMFIFFVFIARIIYQWGIKKMDKVIANSLNVQARLSRFCGIDSYVIYPPIDDKKFKWLGQDNFYLSFARLDELKRVDDVIRAFKKLPQKNLIIASGGPEYDKLKKMIVRHKNIELLGFVSDEKLANLVGNCIASIYIPLHEDFGMSPLEAAAAGKPTIGVDEGGLKETITHKVTGYLVPSVYSNNDLVEAINWLDPAKASGMNGDCKRQAEKFSKEKFVSEIEKVL
ncbi:MAG: glycosyltransferase [bacterium]|nr:glycosyltransferase [bacterium]